MPVSLTNRKNTKITRVGGLASLIHHGSETVRIERVDGTVEIDLCSHDTVTTRGKIGLFLKAECVHVGIYRDRGQTWLVDSFNAERRWPIGGDSSDRVTFQLDSRGDVIWQVPNR